MTPARAIGWDFWHRHRWGFRALGAYLLALATIKVVVVARGVPITFDSDEAFAFSVSVPMSVSFLYLLAVFTYGLSGDLAARRSMYPARMFTLPLSDAALLGWPMLYGAAAMIVVWALTRTLAAWPPELAVPTVWPMTLGAALMMWTQALMWMPYGLPGVRVVAAVLVLCTLDTIVLVALHFKSPEWAIIAITAPQIPLAYVVGRVAVARARRGVVPEWRFRVIPGASRVIPSAARDLHPDLRPRWTAERAQRWYEWRRYGKALPAWVAIILPLELLLLWAAGTSASLVVVIVLGALLTPVVVATFASVSVSRTGESASDAYALSPFIAARPLTDVQLLAAKLRMTVLSTVAAWSLVLLAVPVALYWSGTWATLAQWMRNVVATIGLARGVVFLIVVVAGLMLSTWRQLVQALCIGLTGNARLIKGSVFASLLLASLLAPFLVWLADTRRLGVAWSTMPLILAAFACAKMIAGGAVAQRLVRERTLSDRALIVGAIT
ncbi:MAG TPA: hypothetical protein VJ867_02905, partial [Gemmatimonadaceae bacterium]|nr:hypothetical protein [Gemmatimonadaceae bacterium]